MTDRSEIEMAHAAALKAEADLRAMTAQCERHAKRIDTLERERSTTIWGPWMSKVIQWRNDASVGDNGEVPQVDLNFDGRWWKVEARSFYDGCADARAHDLEAAAQEVFERLTSHPERQLEAEINSTAMALARVTGCGLTVARHKIDEILNAYGSRNG